MRLVFAPLFPLTTQNPGPGFSRRARLTSGVFALLAVSAQVGAAEPGTLEEEVRPLLTKHCLACHGPEVQQSGIRLDNLSEDLVEHRGDAETWRNVLNQLRRDEMPPKGLPRPDPHQRDRAINALKGAIEQAIAKRRSTDGRPVLRRLNRSEYQNTMTDLMGFELDYARDIPPDGLSPDGFRNNGASLRMTSVQLEYYLEAARKALARAIVTGGPPETFFHVFTKSNVKGWLLPEEQIAKTSFVNRTDAFLGNMEPCYPEAGEFLVRVTAGADLKPGKGPPVMEVSVGYRPDTKILFRAAGKVELTSPDAQTFEFRGRMENHPKPVRGQSKFPGLVVRVTNAYDDGTPRPKMQTRKNEDGKNVRFYEEEPGFPKVRVDKVTFEGPVFDRWPPDHHRRILFDSPVQDAAYAREVIYRFMARAWRRPPKSAEVGRYVTFFESLGGEFPVFEERMRETLAMVLISPEFLYLMEPGSSEKRPLDAWETASRLSYFLWSTMPDERLFSLAESGALLQPERLDAEVERMITDPRAWRLIDEFAHDWLLLGAIDQVVVSEDYYPNFSDHLRQQMREETRHFLMEVLRNDLSAKNLIRSDFLMLNETMARHYGMEGVRGSKFRRVQLDDESPRGGLLTQASVLMGASTGEDSHPIKRAVWVRKRLLDDPPPPPPPNVPELDSQNPQFASLSIREQLRLHRTEAGCNMCHREIDPWGVAFEHFDALGQWRDRIRRMRPKANKEADAEFDLSPVDAHETLPDGTPINGVDDLRAYLLESRNEDFARTLVTKVLAYGLGRSLELTDQPDVDRLTASFIADDMRLKGLVKEVVKSDPFRTK